MKFWYVSTLGLLVLVVPGNAKEPVATVLQGSEGALWASQGTPRFVHGRVIVAPPIAERVSPFRHKGILRAFAKGSAGILRARPAELSQVRQVFTRELLNHFPSVDKLRKFQQVTQADTVLLPLLRFLPKDQIIAEIWAFSSNHTKAVKIAETELIHKEAMGGLYMVGPCVNPGVETTAPDWPVTAQQQTLARIHPGLYSGGSVSGYSPEEAEGAFYRIGNALGYRARESFDTVWPSRTDGFVAVNKGALSIRVPDKVKEITVLSRPTQSKNAFFPGSLFSSPKDSGFSIPTPPKTSPTK